MGPTIKKLALQEHRGCKREDKRARATINKLRQKKEEKRSQKKKRSESGGGFNGMPTIYTELGRNVLGAENLALKVLHEVANLHLRPLHGGCRLCWIRKYLQVWRD